MASLLTGYASSDDEGPSGSASAAPAVAIGASANRLPQPSKGNDDDEEEDAAAEEQAKKDMYALNGLGNGRNGTSGVQKDVTMQVQAAPDVLAEVRIHAPGSPECLADGRATGPRLLVGSDHAADGQGRLCQLDL